LENSRTHAQGRVDEASLLDWEFLRVGRRAGVGRHVFFERPGCGRQVPAGIVLRPGEVFRNGLGKGGGVLEIRSFDEERKGAESIGFVGVADSVGLGQDDDGQLFELGLRLAPAQDFEAVSQGQSQVQEEQVRHGELRAIGETCESGKVRDSILAIAHGHQQVRETSLVESALGQDDVVVVILG
jgi:hypothetical protein